MRLLIIGLNYTPESTSYTAELCEYLVRRGHNVQVITAFPIVPNWKIWPEYRHKYFMREVIRDVPVLRSYLYVPENPARPFSRIMFDTSFSVSAFASSWATAGCDLVVAVLPPLQMGILAYLTSRLKRAPLFVHLQDIVPDVAVATGALRDGSVAVKIAHVMERFTYSRAKGIGVICEGFADNLRAKGVPASKIAILPNWVDLTVIQPGEQSNEFRATQALAPDDFVVMYSGSVSAKQGLETLVEAAALLREHPRIQFCIIGEGPRLEHVKDMAARLALANIRFLPFQPREGLATQLTAADVLVIAQRAAVTDVVLPGKLTTYLASARPLIASANANSETARYIRNAKAGLVVAPEDPQASARAVSQMYEQPSLARTLGKNGRQYAETHFDKSRALERFAVHLENVARH